MNDNSDIKIIILDDHIYIIFLRYYINKTIQKIYKRE